MTYMRNTSFLIVLALGWLLGCTSGKEETTEVRVVDLREKVKFRLSEIVEKVEYVPLETTEESLIGNLEKVKKAKDKYYIFDREHTVLVFSESGDHLYTIGQKGGGPGEYSWIYDFSVDPKTGEVYLLDLGKNVLVFEGPKFIRRIELPKTADKVHYWDGKLFLHTAVDPGGHGLIVTDLDGNIIKEFLPQETSDQSLEISRANALFQGGDTTYLLPLMEVNRYKIIGDQVIKNQPELEFKDPPMLMRDIPSGEAFQSYYNDHVFITGGYYEDPTFLTFQYREDYLYRFIYHKPSGKFWNGHITNDLSVLGVVDQAGSLVVFNDRDEHTLIGYLPSFVVLRAPELLKDKELPDYYTPEMVSAFEEVTNGYAESSNPVLVLYHLNEEWR